jgi:predicted TIM-barrel fold metal-dependent hydrolase
MASRRDFCRFLSYGSAALFSASCGIRTVRPPVCDHYAHPTPPLVIDSHCHIFNASDLQVRGFIADVVFRCDLQNPIRELAEPLQALGWYFAPSAREEIAWLRSRKDPHAVTVLPTSAPRSSGDVQELRPFVVQEGRFSGRDFSNSRQRFEAFLDATREHPVYRANFERFYEKFSRSVPLTRTTAPELESSRFATTHVFQRTDLLLRLQRAERGAGKNYLGFIFPFFRYRIENAWTMLDVFGCKGDPKVDMIVHALLDYDLWLGDAKGPHSGQTPSTMVEQIEVSAEIARATQGRVHGLAPFNPWRAACNPAYRELMFDAVRSHGSLGFKLYPTLGFSAAGDLSTSDPLPCPGHAAVGAREVKEQLDALYKFCEDNGAVVIAHASPSNGPSYAAEMEAGPDGWEDVIARHPNLRACVAHFGGSHGDPDEQCPGDGPEPYWRPAFAQLAVSAKTFYGDFAYYSEVLEDKDAAGREKLRTELSALFKDPSYKGVTQRTLYGSDWSMLGRENGWPNYLSNLYNFLHNDVGLEAPQLGSIFGANAIDFFGLRASEPNGRRIDDFHKKQGQVWVMRERIPG